jgi:uncharacterized membrane protein (DUF4010 family)
VYTAGGFAMITSTFLLLWSAMGSIHMGLGLVEPPGRSATELAVLTVVVYPLLFLTGLYTINHRIVALVLGAMIACGWTLALALAALQFNVGLMRLDIMSAAHESPFYRYQVVSPSGSLPDGRSSVGPSKVT